MHHRLAPKQHRFDYRLFYLAVDLEELPLLHRQLRLFSFNRANLYSIRDDDFFPTRQARHNPSVTPPHVGQGGLRERVIGYLQAMGIESPDARVMLVTLPRIAGYLFNPVSFYFCFDRRGEPLAAVAEVTNTFREMKLYPVVERGGERVFRCRVPKDFYVSPFSPVDDAFEFVLRVPDGNLSIRIDDFAGGERMLISTLQGDRLPLSDARLAWFTVKYPLLTLRVIALIHWHALQLWAKRLPWFRKAARAEAQRDLYRPHQSLASAIKS